MTAFWVVRDRSTGEEQYPQTATDGFPPYNAVDFEVAMLPREIDDAAERWDWEAGEIVCRFTPQEAHDIQWERAKAYRDETRYFTTLPVADVVPGAVVIVECDAKSRIKVSDLAQAATWASIREADPEFEGPPFSITFTDGANVQFTINAEQTIAIKAAVTRNDALCHAASQLVRAALADAIEAEATADEIFEIDITAGYPALEP